MQKKSLILSLAVMSSLLFSEEATLAKIPHHEKFVSQWKLVENFESQSEKIQEWVPVNESAENCTRSFGVQLYTLEKDYDVKHFYRLFVDTLSAEFTEDSNPFYFETLFENDKEILFSWWTDDATFEIGREWVHILKGDKKQILFVRFATKDKNIDPANAEWLDCVEKAAFATSITNK